MMPRGTFPLCLDRPNRQHFRGADDRASYERMLPAKAPHFLQVDYLFTVCTAQRWPSVVTVTAPS